MHKILTPLLFFLFGAPVYAGNFATCILEMAPGTLNDAVSHAVFQECTRRYPGGYAEIDKGSGLSWIPFVGYRSPATCVINQAEKTSNHRASMMINMACHCLYGKATDEGEPCFKPSFTPVR